MDCSQDTCRDGHSSPPPSPPVSMDVSHIQRFRGGGSEEATERDNADTDTAKIPCPSKGCTAIIARSDMRMHLAACYYFRFVNATLEVERGGNDANFFYDGVHASANKRRRLDDGDDGE